MAGAWRGHVRASRSPSAISDRRPGHPQGPPRWTAAFQHRMRGGSTPPARAVRRRPRVGDAPGPTYRTDRVVPERRFELPRPEGLPILSRLRLPFRHSGVPSVADRMGRASQRRSLKVETSSGEVEATSGFEPLNRGFADLRVKPLHHVASGSQPGDCAIEAPGRAPGSRGPGIRDLPGAIWLPLEDSNLA